MTERQKIFRLKKIKKREREKEDKGRGVGEKRSPWQHKQTYHKHMRAIAPFIFLLLHLPLIFIPLSPSSPLVLSVFKEQSNTKQTLSAHKFSSHRLNLNMLAVNSILYTRCKSRSIYDSASATVAVGLGMFAVTADACIMQPNSFWHFRVFKRSHLT